MSTAPRKTKLDKARERVALASLAVSEKRLARVLAKYDATETSKARRQPVRETTGEEGVYTQQKRQLGNNIGRDLERNYAPARGILHQFRQNVVGPMGKLQVNADGGQEAAAWFNGEWAKDCDFRDDTHWSTILQNVVAGVLREGDLLAVVDDGLVEDSGKLIHWESDQIVPLTPVALTAAPAPYRDASQENGILRDTEGRVLGYVATGRRGLTVLDEIKDATIWARGNARLIRNPWRVNQGRGVPSLITSATNFLDLYEILAAELLAAKRAAQIAGYTKRTSAETGYDSPASAPEYLPENMGKTAATVDAEAANSTDPTATNYERFENLFGGGWEYLDPGDEVGVLDMPRPNVHLPEFIEAILGHAGASMGLARAYTILRADSSYTAFRGDMILSWVTFYSLQKWLERTYADWVARKVLAWGQRKGVCPNLPAGWERTLSWQWPTMPHVDEAREEAATQNALKNATTDYATLLGPDWETKLEAFAAQLDKARLLGLPLSVFESVSGSELEAESTDNTGDGTGSDDENGMGKWLN